MYGGPFPCFLLRSVKMLEIIIRRIRPYFTEYIFRGPYGEYRGELTGEPLSLQTVLGAHLQELQDGIGWFTLQDFIGVIATTRDHPVSITIRGGDEHLIDGPVEEILAEIHSLMDAREEKWMESLTVCNVVTP